MAALALQFQLPFWQYLCGLHDLGPEKKAHIDIPRLRRRLSVLLYALSAGFLGGALLQYLKVLSGSSVLPLYFLLILLVYDGVWFFYRRFDRNAYSDSARRAARFLRLFVNLALLLLLFIFYTPIA